MEHESLTRTIIAGAMKVHGTLGPGFLETVYVNALAIELRARGLLVDRELRFKVHYAGVVVGDYSADLFVERKVLVEAKAVRALESKHEMQLVNYLTATQLDVGLLLNFGGDSLQIRRKTRVFTANDQRREPTQAQDITPSTATTDVARGRIDAQG